MSNEEMSDRPGEPVRRGEGAEGFPHGSKYPLFVALGMFFTGLGLSMFTVALAIGIPVLIYGMWGWTKEYTIEEFETGIVPAQKRQLLGFKSGYISMLLVILGELIIFASLFVVWFYLKATRGPFPPEGMPGPDLMLGIVMTVLLLAASVALGYGRYAIARDERTPFNWGLALSMVFGVAYLVVFALDWINLAAGGAVPSQGPYPAAYYVLTGTHAAHLLAGLVLSGIIAYRAWGRNHFSSNRHLMVKTTEAYWHFLTFVSILILAFVYFPG
ncbi:cytochrome c oxidase subunit 3 [Salinirarus marinus]|uniref:cytochrome c oxidase subunit 3 n=1 Tax=Salinirarus marinus TaxID=3068310 RepID=UPI003C6C5D53